MSQPTFTVTTTGFSTDIVNNNLTTPPPPSAPHFLCYVNSANYAFPPTPQTTGAQPPKQLVNPCLNQLVKDSIPFIYYSGSQAVSVAPITPTSWGTYTDLFPNGFALLSLEESSSQPSAAINYRIYNNNSDAYQMTIPRFAAVLLYNNTSSPQFTANYSLYGASNNLISTTPINPVSGLKYNVIQNISVTIPVGGYLQFEIKRTRYQANINIYLLLSFTGVTYVTPTISFITPLNVTLGYQEQTNYEITTAITTDIARNPLTGATVTFYCVDSSTGMQTTLGTSTVTSNNTATLLLTDRQFGVSNLPAITAVYNVSPLFPQYASCQTSSPVYISIRAHDFVPTITVSNVTNTSLNTSTPVVSSLTDTVRVTVAIDNVYQIPGTLSIYSGKITFASTGINRWVGTFVPKTIGLNAGQTASIFAQFTKSTSNYNYTGAGQTISVELAVKPVQMVMVPLASSSVSAEDSISFEAYPANNGVLGDKSVVSLITGAVDFLVTNTSTSVVTTLTGTFGTDRQSYISSPVSTLSIGSYTVVARMTDSSYIRGDGASLPVTVATSTSQTFSIVQQPTDITVTNTAIQNIHDIPFTVTGTLTGVSTYPSISGTFYLNSVVSGVSTQINTTFYSTTLTGTAFTMNVTSPKDIGVNNLSTGSFTISWVESTGEFETSTSSVFTVEATPNVVVTQLTCTNLGSVSSLEDTFQFSLAVASVTNSSTLANAGQVQIYYTTPILSTPQALGSSVFDPTMPYTFSFRPIGYNGTPGDYSFHATYRVGTVDEDSVFTADSNFLSSTSPSTTISVSKVQTVMSTFSFINATSKAVMSSIPITTPVNATSTVLTKGGNVIPGTVVYQYYISSAWTTFLTGIGSPFTLGEDGTVTTPNFTFLQEHINTGSYSMKSVFTPTDSSRYYGIQVTSTHSVTTASSVLSFATLAFTNPTPTYSEALTLNVSIVPYVNGAGEYMSLSGSLVIANGVSTIATYPVTFANNTVVSITSSTPQAFGLNASTTPYALTATFTPSGTYSNFSQVVSNFNVTVNPQPVSLTLTAPSTRVYGQNIPVVVAATAFSAPATISGTINIVVSGQTIGTYTTATASSTSTVQSTLVGTTLNASTTAYTLSATFTSSDTNYSSTLTSVTTTSVTVSTAAVTLASLSLDGINQTSDSGYFIDGVGKLKGSNLIVSGQLSSTYTTVTSGTITIKSRYVSDGTPITVTYASMPVVSADGTFSSVVSIDENGIYNDGVFYFEFNDTTNFVSTSFISSVVPGEFYLTIQYFEYDVTMSLANNGYTDYQDGVFTVTSTMSTPLSSVSQTYAQANSEGNMVFQLLQNQSGTAVVIYTTTVANADLVVESGSTKAVWSFNPKTNGLNTGTYLIKSFFSGINGYYDSQDASSTVDSTYFITFSVTKTTPALKMSVTLTPQDGMPVTSIYYKQVPYLNVAIRTPATINAAYVTGNDVLGASVYLASGVAISFNNSYDPSNANGSVNANRLVNILNVKTVQFPILAATTRNINVVFTPADTTNFTSLTYTMNFTINKYTPVILANSIQVVTQIAPASNLLYPGTTLASGLINYDESFDIINSLQQFDNGSVDYSGIDGTMKYSYGILDSSPGPAPVFVGSLTTHRFYTLNVGETYSFVLNGDFGTIDIGTNNGVSTPIITPAGTKTLAGGSSNVRLRDYSDVILTVTIPANMTSLTISTGSGEATFDTSAGNGYARYVSIGAGSSAASSFLIYTGVVPIVNSLNLGTQLSSITQTENYLTWTANVNANQISQSNGGSYRLNMTFVPADQDNYTNSVTMIDTFSVYVANALGSLGITIPQPVVSYNATSNISVQNDINFLSTVNRQSGTVTYYNGSTSASALSTFAITSGGISTGAFSNALLTAAYAPYYIYATLASSSSDYPTIVQNTPQSVQINPKIVLSTVPDFQYSQPSTITVTMTTGNAPYSGGMALFTFTNTQTGTVTCTYSMPLTDNVASFLTTNVTGSNGVLVSADLVIGTYSVSCAVTFTDMSYRDVTTASSVNFGVQAYTVPYSLSVSPGNIIYKNSKPTITSTFVTPVYGGTITYTVKHALTPTDGFSVVYNQELTTTITTQTTTYTFEIPDDMLVGSYVISSSFNNDNYGVYTSTNSTRFVVNKNNVVVNPLNTGSAYYTMSAPFTLSASLTVPNSDSVIDSSVKFTIFNSSSSTSYTALYSAGQYTTSLISGLSAGTYGVIAYFAGNANYTTSNIVTTNLVIEKVYLFKGDLLSVGPLVFSATGNGSYFPITVASQSGDTVNVFTISNQQPLTRFTYAGSTTYNLYAQLLQTGAGDIFVTVTNNNYTYLSNVFQIILEPQSITTITVTSSTPTTVAYNTSVQFTATIQQPGFIAVNEGRIVFRINGSVAGSVDVGNNTAQIYFTLYTIGTVTVTASYINSANYTGTSVGTLVMTVNKATPVVTLVDTTPSANSFNNQKMITATITSGPGIDTINSGHMTFYNNGIVLFDKVPVNACVATIYLLAEQSSYSLTAVYSGNNNFLVSALSNTLSLSISMGPITNDYSGLTFRSPITGNVLAATATVSTKGSNNSSILLNSGYVTFLLNGTSVNACIVNGVATASFVSNSSTDVPTATYYNPNYTGSITGTNPDLVRNFIGSTLQANTNYTLRMRVPSTNFTWQLQPWIILNNVRFSSTILFQNSMQPTGLVTFNSSIFNNTVHTLTFGYGESVWTIDMVPGNVISNPTDSNGGKGLLGSIMTITY